MEAIIVFWIASSWLGMMVALPATPKQSLEYKIQGTKEKIRACEDDLEYFGDRLTKDEGEIRRQSARRKVLIEKLEELEKIRQGK